MPERSYGEAFRAAYTETLRDFPESFLMGEDVQVAMTGTSVGLFDEFGPDRVRETPISEQAFTGAGVGAAMYGKRPIVEYQINTLPHVAFEQLANQAQKIRYMSGGRFSVPMTVVVPTAGAPGGTAGQHSDNPYPGLMHYGVKTVVPTTPYDVKGLFRSAVAEDDPVVIYFPVGLHSRRGEVPEEAYSVPLGEADVKRSGGDVTIVAVGEMVPEALAVAEARAGEVDVEVIDPRTLLPLDLETIVESVERTGRVIVTDAANRTCGFSRDVAARLADRAFWALDAPIKTVSRATVPIAYNPPEEEAVKPDREALEAAVDAVVW